MNEEQNAGLAAREFDIAGNLIEATPFGSGHINDT
jgi:hypothetical protein